VAGLQLMAHDIWLTCSPLSGNYDALLPRTFLSAADKRSSICFGQ
jgi:hypothetical protein